MRQPMSRKVDVPSVFGTSAMRSFKSVAPAAQWRGFQ